MAVVPLIKPLHSIHPGEWYFGAEYERLHTLLGSCVALTAWHPRLKIGGMCHYLLATPAAQKHSGRDLPSGGVIDCRYAVHALAQMKKVMQAYADITEYQLGLFGGGDMFAFHSPKSIGQDNIAYACQWLRREKLQPSQTDVGGAISRSLMLVIATGEIQVKHYQMDAT